jgi:NDP-sugar pyrophosphorylase family protein
MRFAIIAAGEGSRLRSEGVATPKPLVRVLGEPLIGRLFRLAKRQGATSVAVIVNEEMTEVGEYLRSGRWQLPVELLVRSTPSSLHSLAALSPWLEGAPFCLFTVDTVFLERELAAFLSHAQAAQDLSGVLAVTDFVRDEKPLYARLSPDRRIVAFEDAASDSPWVTGGIYYFQPRVLPDVRQAVASGVVLLRNALRSLLERGHTFAAFPFSRIVDVDHSSDVKDAEALLASESSLSGAAEVV